MRTRERLISLLILLSALVQITVSADLRAADQWSWRPASGEESAKAWVPATGQQDLALAITFPTARRCYTADLMLTDSAGQVLPRERVTVTADGDSFVLSASPSDIVGVNEAPPPVFHAIKRARTLRLTTSDAAYTFSSTGSAAAINSAYKACVDDLRAETVDDTNPTDRPVPMQRAEGPAKNPTGVRSDEALAEPLVSGPSTRRTVSVIIALMFAIGNAFLFLELIAKTVSLPPLSPAASGQWRRGAARVGTAGWIVLPLMGYAVYGLPGVALALVGYLTAGLIIAAVVNPSVIRHATGHIIDAARDLRLRAMGVRRGSRLIVEGFRRVARRHATAPTEKTTDAEILKLFERVGSAFKTVADQRRESLKGPRLNHIVWQFLQAHEALSDEAFEAYLQRELSTYLRHGLPSVYRRELEL